MVLDVTHFSVPLAHQVWRLTRIEPPLGDRRRLAYPSRSEVSGQGKD